MDGQRHCRIRACRGALQRGGVLGYGRGDFLQIVERATPVAGHLDRMVGIRVFVHVRGERVGAGLIVERVGGAGADQRMIALASATLGASDSATISSPTAGTGITRADGSKSA